MSRNPAIIDKTTFQISNPFFIPVFLMQNTHECAGKYNDSVYFMKALTTHTILKKRSKLNLLLPVNNIC
jgi:hypothetical protein